MKNFSSLAMPVVALSIFLLLGSIFFVSVHAQTQGQASDDSGSASEDGSAQESGSNPSASESATPQDTQQTETDQSAASDQVKDSNSEKSKSERESANSDEKTQTGAEDNANKGAMQASANENSPSDEEVESNSDALYLDLDEVSKELSKPESENKQSPDAEKTTNENANEEEAVYLELDKVEKHLEMKSSQKTKTKVRELREKTIAKEEVEAQKKDGGNGLSKGKTKDEHASKPAQENKVKRAAKSHRKTNIPTETNNSESNGLNQKTNALKRAQANENEHKTEVERKTSKPEKQSQRDNEEGKIKYVLYRERKKEIETLMPKDEFVEIYKQEDVILARGVWKKRVKVYSETHYAHPLTVYVDIMPSEESDIRVFWEEENKEVDFQAIDDDGDGLAERISWVVPHLSEQNFEVRVTLHGNEVEGNLTLELIRAPTGVMNESSELEFEFNVSYANLSAVECDFNITNETGEIVFEDNNFNLSHEIDVNQSLKNGEYSWALLCYDENDAENLTKRDSLDGNFTISVDYTPNVLFSADNTSVIEGQEVAFHLNISAAFNISGEYIIYFGDGSNASGTFTQTQEVVAEINHAYSDAGSYVAHLAGSTEDVSLEGLADDITISVSAPPQNDTGNNTSSNDNSSAPDTNKPNIELIEPDENAEIHLSSTDDKITFKYNASDDVGLANCTFTLFYYNNSLLGEQAYTETNTSLANGAIDSVELLNFDEGKYTWDVECYDTSANSRSKSRDFEVVYPDEQSSNTTNSSASANSEQDSGTTNEENTDLIARADELVKKINDFLVREENYGRDEREAVSDLGLADELKFYKKKLLQMKVDLEHNLDFIREEKRKEERLSEISSEMDDIASKIPTDIRVIDTYEYLKNILEPNVDEVVDAYIEANSIDASDSVRRAMVRENEQIQELIAVSVNVKSVELTFDDRAEEFILVRKDVKFSSKDFQSLMEVIPKEIASSADDVEFVTEAKVVKSDPIFSVALDKLKNDRFVYKIKGSMKLEDIEKTSTLAFNEKIPEDSLTGLTGFVTLITRTELKNAWFYISWALFLAFAIFTSGVLVRKVKQRKWLEDEDVRQIRDILKDIASALANKDLQLAKNLYLQAKDVYGLAQPEAKQFIYPRMKKAFVTINKVELNTLAKEFILAVREKRDSDAVMIYSKIKKLYQHVPLKIKEEVYRRISPYLRALQSRRR